MERRLEDVLLMEEREGRGLVRFLCDLVRLIRKKKEHRLISSAYIEMMFDTGLQTIQTDARVLLHEIYLKVGFRAHPSETIKFLPVRLLLAL